jgi:hypothetical protein
MHQATSGPAAQPTNREDRSCRCKGRSDLAPRRRLTQFVQMPAHRMRQEMQQYERCAWRVALLSPFICAESLPAGARSSSGTVARFSAPRQPVSRRGAEGRGPRSESETSGQLNLAVAVNFGSFNLSEVLSGQVGIRVCELRCVEEVERVSVQFQRVPLREVNVLLRAQVHHAITRSVDLVAARVPRRVIHVWPFAETVGGLANEAGLNQCPEMLLGYEMPATRSGRFPGLNSPVERSVGVPDCTKAIRLVCHPPISQSMGREILPPKRCPRPKGNR